MSVLLGYPIRQWVLSRYPFEIAGWQDTQVELGKRGFRVSFTAAISTYIFNRAGFQITSQDTVAVTLIQRFGTTHSY